MKTTILKSIGAVLAGFLFIGITHTATDAILETFGVLPKGHLNVNASLILFVIFYRAVFSVAGCYITAWLAPAKPMKHALILGGVGMILSTIGAIITTDMNIGPDWYAWSLVIISLPIAWVAAKLYFLRNKPTSSAV